MKSTKKGSIAALIAIPLLFGATACSSSASNGDGSSAACAPSNAKVTTLTYWSWIPAAKAVVAKFNATHPKIHVVLQTVAGDGSAYQTYFNALKAGNQPDVAMVEYDHLANLRAQTALTDISACAPIKNLKSSVVPWTYNQVTLGTKAVYATPTDTGPLALYYRKDLFAKYGISVPTTWAQYEDAAIKLQQADPSAYITSMTPQDQGLLQGLDWQAGAKPYSYTSSKFVLDMNNAATNKVSTYWQNMIDKKLIDTTLQPFSPGLYKAWGDGTVATAIGASWLSGIMSSSAAAANGNWAVAPLPEWAAGQKTGANYGGATTAVLKGTKHLYEAAVFADWLSTNPDAYKIIYAAGGTSASLGYAKSGALDLKLPYFGNQEIFKVFQAASNQTDTTFQWAPNQTNVNSYLQDALGAPFTGSGTIEQAYAKAQVAAAANLKTQGIPVTVK